MRPVGPGRPRLEEGGDAEAGERAARQRRRDQRRHQLDAAATVVQPAPPHHNAGRGPKDLHANPVRRLQPDRQVSGRRGQRRQRGRHLDLAGRAVLVRLDLRVVALQHRRQGSLVHLVGCHLLLLLGHRDGAAAVAVADDVPAADQPDELVVRALVVLVESAKAGDLPLHLLDLGEPLLERLLLLGLPRLLGVELRLRLAALGLDEDVRHSCTYLDLQHVGGAAVAHGDRRAALERGGELRLHADEQVVVLRHLAVPLQHALGAPLDEGLADDRGPDVDHPVPRQLRYLVLLARQVLVHRIVLREVVEDLRHGQVLVLRHGQVAHRVRRHDYNGQRVLALLTLLVALDEGLQVVHRDRLEGREVDLAVDGEEGVDLALVPVLRGEGVDVDELRLHLEVEMPDQFGLE